MHPVDVAVVVCYFLIVIGLGFWYRRWAARNLDSYFLGGRRIHWLALAMSGSVSNFDITGTMWIVTLITLFGMKSMWNHWMWGFLMGAFFLGFMGKWIRRSGVMTGAEWMVTRFGDGVDGFAARTAYALMAVVTVAGFIGYAFQGIGKFAAVYVDADPRLCAAVILSATTLYVLLGGLYSVVVTDVIQTVILSIAAVLIAGVAYVKVEAESLSERLPAGFASLWPTWRLSPQEAARVADTDYAVYQLFGALVLVWVLKGLLLNLGGPAQMYDFQRFLAARDARDAAKIGAAWSGFLIVRWAMAMGIALLALTAADFGGDPEQVMPRVLQQYLPWGLRGLVIAGLLAAFMSTFSSTINSGASYLVRDLWQPLVRPDAGPKQLIWASYAATAALVAVGTAIGLGAPSIRAVFDWIMGALGAAFIVPNVLRWYWWRLNGWGYAMGTLAGLATALVVPFVPGLAPLYVAFPLVSTVSLIGTLAATLLTRPTDADTLASFYSTVRPLGLWGRIRRRYILAGKGKESGYAGESATLAWVNVVFAAAAILGAYLSPMYLVGHWHGQSLAAAVVALGAIVVLYFTWYRNLPPAEPADQGTSSRPAENV